jgi:DNA-directed RNA polymerase subunit RPC12/RpoP
MPKKKSIVSYWEDTRDVEVVCPYCGKLQYEQWEVKMEKEDVQCHDCKKIFVAKIEN